MEWIITKHARERKEERLGNVRIEFKSKISKYKYRYLDHTYKWHIYDTVLGVEIIGKQSYDEFYVLTIIENSLEEYLEKSVEFETGKYSNYFKYNIKLK